MSELAGPAQAFLDQARRRVAGDGGHGRRARQALARAGRGGRSRCAARVDGAARGAVVDDRGVARLGDVRAVLPAAADAERPVVDSDPLAGGGRRAGCACCGSTGRSRWVWWWPSWPGSRWRRPTRVLPKSPVDLRVINPIGFDADASEPVVRALHPRPVPRRHRGAGAVAAAGARGAGRHRARRHRTAGARARPAYRSISRRPTAPPARSTASSSAGRRSTRSCRRRPSPSVSIVMATKRPEMLEHALAQVRPAARRRAPRAGAGSARVRSRSDVADATVVPQPESEVFGDVLNAAVAAATGDVVLKMDDDDWYAPDFVADLLRARAYSGADLVGTADEFYYLADRDLTVQRRHPGEFYTQWVAGGTLLLDRSLLREVGGFAPVPRARRPPPARRAARRRRHDLPHPRPRLRAPAYRRRPHLRRRPRQDPRPRAGRRHLARLPPQQPARPADPSKLDGSASSGGRGRGRSSRRSARRRGRGRCGRRGSACGVRRHRPPRCRPRGTPATR